MSGLRGQGDDPGTTDDVDLDTLIDGNDPEPEPDPDDESEDDTEPGDSTDAEPAPEPSGEGTGQKPQPNPSKRITALTRQIDAERREKEEAKRYAQQLERQLSQSRAPPPAPPDPNVERERERQEIERLVFAAQSQGQDASAAVARYYSEQSEKRIREAMQLAELRMADRLDQQAFAALQREMPIARRLASRIEEALPQMRQMGMNPTREAVLKFLVGEEILAKTGKQVEAQRRRGRQQIAAQTTTPAPARSTAQPERGRRDDNSMEAVERRLQDIVF